MATKSLHDQLTSDLPMALREGEAVLARAEISTGIYWKAIAVFVIAVCISMLAWQLGILFFAVTAVLAAYGFLMRSALMMIVTNQRILVRQGIIKVDTLQLRYDRIESVEIQRTIPGQILSYATVVITGTGSRLAFIPYIANATNLRNIIDDLLYKREQANQKNPDA